MFTDMTRILQPGKKGCAEIQHYVITAKEADRALLRSLFISRDRPAKEGGKYVMLKVNGSCMMSNTPMEQDTNTSIVHSARGDMLIAGLGIGLILIPILKNPEVRSVTVIELEQDVIDLVLPQLKSIEGFEKLTVIQADIFQWKPPKGKMWDIIYFDIWESITSDNLPQMTKLRRRFCRRKRPKGFMSAWEYRACLRMRNANR